jgi:hypothetical protein
MFELISKSYKGFVIQQVPENHYWQIVIMPNRNRYGFISPGPYASFNIAKHVIDVILNQDFQDENQDSY